MIMIIMIHLIIAMIFVPCSPVQLGVWVPRDLREQLLSLSLWLDRSIIIINIIIMTWWLGNSR